MNCKILIISNPGEIGSDNYCTGVNLDVKNYINFFTSLKGGAWKHKDIIHLNRPTEKVLHENLIKINNADYSIIIFCGHGCALRREYNESTLLELQENVFVDSVLFNKKENRRLIILDSCRNLPCDENENIGMESVLMEAYNENVIMADKVRKIYERKIAECPKNSLIVIYSCSLNESANDDDKLGGVFSYYLLKAVDKLLEERKEESINVVAVFNQAKKDVESFIKNQTPNIIKPRSAPFFPFAIKVNPFYFIFS